MAITGQEIEKHIMEHQENVTYWFRYLAGGVLTLFGLLVAYIWRKLENRITAQADWRVKLEEGGGVVNGDKLVAAIKEVAGQMAKACKENRGECQAEFCRRLEDLETWRKDMADKGGPMLRSEHIAACERAAERAVQTYMKMMDTLFAHHREWVQKGLENIQLSIEKDVLEELRSLGARIPSSGK